MQLIFAGKAHPLDEPGKELLRTVVQESQRPRLRDRIVFLEDYDMHVARYLVQGVDVWLNVPRRPLEASGTSGMKAAVNGGLNLSVLDGWWAEGYTPDTGWAIGSGEQYEDPEENDAVEAEALYTLLEREVIPAFYSRDSSGRPREWTTMMTASIRNAGGRFSTGRMVRDYAERAYLPAHRASVRARRRQGRGRRGDGPLARAHGGRLAERERPQRDRAPTARSPWAPTLAVEVVATLGLARHRRRARRGGGRHAGRPGRPRAAPRRRGHPRGRGRGASSASWPSCPRPRAAAWRSPRASCRYGPTAAAPSRTS